MLSAQRTYAMLGNQSLWDVAKSCHDALGRAHVPYAILGGVAVCLHGYQRNTLDLDVLLRPEDADAARAALESAGMQWDGENHEFRTPSGVAVQILLAGERAGPDSLVRLPDPANAAVVTEVEGLAVLRLSALIESKLACGEANLRRTHKDFADVVELVAHHGLSAEFARHLHKSLRPTFRQLLRNAQS